MLKEKALRTIKAEFKEYKQRILTNLSKEYIFEIAYQIYVKSRIYDFLIKGWEYPSEIYEIIISLHKHKINILELLKSCSSDDFDYIEESYVDGLYEMRKKIISLCDIVVDGEYIDEKRDLTLKWRGSSNQRVIDVKQSLAQNKIVLYCD